MRRGVSVGMNFLVFSCECQSVTMNENRKIADWVELVKEDTFWPKGQWSIRLGDLVWSRTAGWQKYYVVDREESQFKTAEEAMKAWES
jgi:hypothetical protein